MRKKPKSGIIISIITIIITVIAVIAFTWFIIGSKEEITEFFFAPNNIEEAILLPFSGLFGLAYIIFLGVIIIAADIISIVLGIVGIIVNVRQQNKPWLTTSIVCTVISGLIFLTMAVDIAITALSA